MNKKNIPRVIKHTVSQEFSEKIENLVYDQVMLDLYTNADIINTYPETYQVNFNFFGNDLSVLFPHPSSIEIKRIQKQSKRYLD